MSRRSVEEELIAVQTLLHESAFKIARAESNLRQEMGGYPSMTPGNGAPGGGKGGGPTLEVSDPTDPVTTWHTTDDAERRPFPLTSNVARVPVTSVELAVLAGDRDTAAEDLRLLRRDVPVVGERFAAAAASAWHPVDYRPRPTDSLTATLVRAFGAASELVRCDDAHRPQVQEALGLGRDLFPLVDRLFVKVRAWGYKPSTSPASPHAAELLAVDLTEQWCTSHLRLGVKRPRYRGELCQWCVRTAALVATWTAPPLGLVRIHVEEGRVHAHQFEQFARQERDRQRNLSKHRRNSK